MEHVMAFPSYMRRGTAFTINRLVPKAFVLLVCLALVACSFASFISAAQSDIPVVVQMVTNITNIVAPGVSAALVAAGGLALTALQVLCGSPAPGAAKCDPSSLIGQYQVATDPSVKTTLLQKIQAALAAVNSHITDMLNVAKGLPSAVGAAIVTAVGVALSTITLLISLVPVAASAVRGVRPTSTQQDALKAMPGPKQLKAQFNGAISAQFPSAVIQ